jgi:acetyl-CoA carboxylase, biotin carboxylase subunit
VQAQEEARASFGDGRMYLERFLEEPRHVEIQVFGDGEGEVIHFFDRDCSIQRRYQKMLEEAPSILDPDLRAEIAEAAVRLARHIHYRGAGTCEFLVDREGRYYFSEMNTRIQVEHPVTEMVTRFDLVQEQFRVAAGRACRYARRTCAWRVTRSRCGSTPRTRPRLPALAGPRHRRPLARRTGDPGRLARLLRLPHPSELRQPDRQDHRVGPDPRDGDRTHGAGAARDGRRGCRDDDPLPPASLDNAFYRRGAVYTNFIARRMST